MANTQKIEILALQLADSAFPSGSFAHSGGIEAARNWGEIQSPESLKNYLETVLRQAPFGTLPLIIAAYRKTFRRYAGKRVAIIVCGGNIELEKLQSILAGDFAS